LIAHEPPLFPLLAGTELEPALEEADRRVDAVIALLERGDDEGGAQLFVDTIAFGPDAWDTQLTPEMREVFVKNAPTWLDETRDPDGLQMDLDALSSFDKPALLTSGTDSAPFFGPVVDIVASRIPRADRVTIQGADHVPHISIPDQYVQLVTTFSHSESVEPRQPPTTAN
jgi:pimeloyl-ACP methyl ester carboxylesterase